LIPTVSSETNAVKPLYRAPRKSRRKSVETEPAAPRKFLDALRVKEQLAFAFYAASAKERPLAKPFLKWVGGKTSLLTQLEAFFPPSIDRYFEPFLGGGAVFFHLKYRFPQMSAFLRDSNKELINCYRVVRDRPLELMVFLDQHSEAFQAAGSDYYYRIRKLHALTDDLARAARTIFLNKTCFNGLYRVNARGEFNTPVGSSKNPTLYDHDNLLACSLALRDAQLEAEDFRNLLREAKRGDFIYFDPSYLPISAYSDFKRYTLEQFREADQVELANTYRELDSKGCRVVLFQRCRGEAKSLAKSAFDTSIIVVNIRQ
jgi:DNA adenine methylase